MRILRIAYVSNNRTGGMSRTMYCTGDILNAKGHQVDYLFAESFQATRSSFWQKLMVPLQVPKSIDRLARDGKKYDVVEIHEPLAAPYCIAKQIRKDLPPVVLFSYGIQKRNRQATIAYNKQKNLPIPLSLRYVDVLTVQSTYGLRHANHIICSNSEDIAYVKQMGVPESRLTQHHSGVEPEFILAGNAAVKSDRPRSGILFLGTWSLRKGKLDIIPAVSQVMQRHSSLSFTVAGCSLDPDILLAEFAPDLRHRIKVIPYLSSNEESIELYRQNSIFVLPSYFEGQPLVAIEAAAMGLAIVTTNICGMADFIENGVDGLTIPVGDVAALTDSLERLASDELLARRLGCSANQKAQKYTWASAAEKIALAYERAIEDDAKRGKFPL